jgi:hypothetical protein
MTFQKKKYQVLENAISYDLANFCFDYFVLKRNAVKYMYEKNLLAENPLHGTWHDQQVPGSYSIYADHLMETLLMKMLPIMKKRTKLNLIPTYSYARVYEQGAILKRHKDRPSCEISTTLNLGGDSWPIYIDPTGEDNLIDEYRSIIKPGAHKGVEVNLKPGDMLVYAGCELEHWREPFKGNLCGQVFLHYNHANGQFGKENIYDKRPLLGLPKGF